MIKEPYYFTTNNIPRLISDIRHYDNYICTNCYKPTRTKFIYCNQCHRKLIMSGLERRRVYFKEVGLSTIPYQQHLHRKFFGCNVHYNYRGAKEERIRTHITQETINKSVNKIHNLLTIPTFTYQNKKRDKPDKTLMMYKTVLDTRNITKRITYNALLFYIDYHINKSKQFKSEAHFYSSVIANIHIDIQRTYVRTNKGQIPIFSRSNRLQFKYFYYLSEQLDNIFGELLSEIYE